MHRGPLSVIGAALVVALFAIGSAGAVPARVDLSSASGAAAYLRSIGIDARGVVVQRGARNYAGPNCPGSGWNCTRAPKVVQIATARGLNEYECTGLPQAQDACVVVQTSAAGNLARCMQIDSSSAQSCSITQSSLTGANQAEVKQSIQQGGGLAASPQHATQAAQITQMNASGSNAAVVDQSVMQSLNEPGAAVASAQTSRQSFTILQTDSGGVPISCPSMSGTNSSSATQSLSQQMTAPNAATGTQAQESTLLGHVDQCSSGVSISSNTQTERQNMSAAGPAVIQTQSGPIDCCSSQISNPNNQFSIEQSAVQTASQANGALAPEQVEQMRGTCQTSGNCGLAQETSQNGVEFTNTVSGSSITSVAFCHNGNCTTAPTAATVRSFAAKATGDGVALTWRTTSESRIAGFNVWRTGGGATVRVNARLVPAKVAGHSLGAVYRVIDRRVRSGVLYRYRLQAVKLDGSRVWLGSVRVSSAR